MGPRRTVGPIARLHYQTDGESARALFDLAGGARPGTASRSSRARQHPAKQLGDASPDRGVVARARTGHVERIGRLGVEPRAKPRRRLRLREPVEIEVQHRAPEADRLAPGQQRSSAERAVGDDEGRVRVADVARGADRRIRRSGLAQRSVALGDRPVLGATAPRNPAADPEAVLPCNVPRRPIRPGLAAGDDRARRYSTGRPASRHAFMWPSRSRTFV